MSEWISVKDKLPEVSGDYMVWDPVAKIVQIVHYSKKHNLWNSRDYYSEEEKARFSIDTITHWQPVPAPPVNNA